MNRLRRDRHQKKRTYVVKMEEETRLEKSKQIGSRRDK